MTEEKLSGNTKAGASKIEDIQDRLDRKAAESLLQAGERRERHWPYRRANLNTTVEHPGGGSAKVASHARSLWCEGIALLCSGFSYPGSSYTVVLVSKDGESMSVRGTVVFCRHVEGAFHEVEVKFSQRIDPHLFIEPPRGASGDASTSIELPNLRGKVLHLDDSEADARLLAHHFRGSGIELKAVRTAAEALECLNNSIIDIFLCDLSLGHGVDSSSVIRSAREAGFTGPIVMLTAETSPARLASVKAAGADQVLAKPYQRNALIQTMIKLHQQVGAITSGDVLYSTLGDQPETDELLTSYVAGVRQLVQSMQASILARDFESVREYCLNIKGSAPGYGFAPLGIAAEEALHVMDSTMSINEAKPQLRTLSLICGHLGLRRSTVIPKVEADRLI